MSRLSQLIRVSEVEIRESTRDGSKCRTMIANVQSGCVTFRERYSRNVTVCLFLEKGLVRLIGRVRLYYDDYGIPCKPIGGMVGSANKG